MKKLLIGLCFLPTLLPGQKLVETEFSTVLPMTMADAVRLPGGDFMLTGFAFPQAQDSAMALVMKTDSLLNLKWTRRYRILAKDDFRCITAAKDGNLLVGGTARQSFSNQSGGSVYKIDTAGNVIWYKVYSDSYDDRTLAIHEQPDSSLMVFIRKGVTNQPTKVVHATSSGNIISSRSFYDGSRGLLADAVAWDGNQTYYMAGDFFDGGTGHTLFFIAALTPGNFLWHKVYDLGRTASAYDLLVSPDGHLFACGTIADTSTANTTNAWVMRLDGNGNILWAREYTQPGAYVEFLSDLLSFPDGDLMAWGYGLNDTNGVAIGIRIDSSGNMKGVKGFSHYSGQSVLSTLQLPDGRIFINAAYAGMSYLLLASADAETACSNSSPSLITSALSPTITSPTVNTSSPNITPSTPTLIPSPLAVNQTLICSGSVSFGERPLRKIKLFPMPCRDVLNIEMPEAQSENFELRLLNMCGKTLVFGKYHFQPRLRLDLHLLPAGMYSLQIKTADGLLQEKLLKR